MTTIKNTKDMVIVKNYMNEFTSLMTQTVTYQKFISSNLANEKTHSEEQTVNGFFHPTQRVVKSYDNEDVTVSMIVYVEPSYEPYKYDLVLGKPVLNIEPVTSMLDRTTIVGYKILI